MRSFASRLFFRLVKSCVWFGMEQAAWTAISRIRLISSLDKQSKIESLDIGAFNVGVFEAAGGHC